MRFHFFVLILCSFGLFGQKSALSEGEWIKVSVSKSGIYKIDQTFLKKNSLNTKSLDPQKIRVFVGNSEVLPQPNTSARIKDLVEIPVWCNDTDGKLDNNDRILFYATSPHKEYLDTANSKLKHSLNPYSDENFYFINLGKENAKKLETLQAASSSTAPINTLTFYLYEEKELKNLLSSGRRWFGDFFYNSLNYEIKTPDAQSEIKLNLSVLGVGRSDQTLDLKINNQNISKYTLPRSLYNSADNFARYNRVSNLTEIALDSIKSTSVVNLGLSLSTVGSANAGAYIDFYEIQYDRTLTYDPQNQLQYWYLKRTKETNFKITQNNNDAEIWQISDLYQPRRFDLKSDGTFGSNLKEQETKFLVFNKNDVPTPRFVEKVANQSILNNPTPNMIVVYPEKFKEEVQRLILYKKQIQNLEVLGVSTKEIYNEFSSGKVDPTAIRDLCRYFWLKDKNTLKHLLLVGDASFDYKNNSQFTFVDVNNMIPTYQSNESLEPIYSFSSDDYFGFLEDSEGLWSEGFSQRNIWISNRDNDHTMDISVGRLPAKSLFEVKTLVNKIIGYQNAAIGSGNWKSKITFVADNRDYNIHQQDAESLSALSKEAFGGFEIEKIYLDQFPVTNASTMPQATAALNESIKDGTFLLNYNGHGSEDGWANEKLLTIGDIQNFRNSTRLPIFFTATCQFGKFDNPTLVSGAELSLLNPSGGCIALLTTTRPVYSSTNERINRAFYNNIAKVKTLGELFVLTKNQSIEGEINRNFSLLGDPSQPLPSFQNNVFLTSANGQKAEGQTWKALEKIQLIGKSTKPFSGKIRVAVFDKINKEKTLGTFSDGPSFEFESSSQKIFEGIFTLLNGEFTGTIILPKDQVSGKGRGVVSFYAINQDSTENAYGYFDNFEISSISETNAEDKTEPEVRVSLDANQTLRFEIFDENGINLSNADANHQARMLFNDTTVIRANQLLAPLTGGFEFSLNYFVGNLPSGKHTVKFIVYDSHNNKTEKTFEFNIEKPDFAIVNYANYPNPFSNYTNLIFKHNRLGDDILANLVIYDIFGNTVKAHQKSCKNCDDKIEFGLDFEGNTNVSPQLFYKLNLLAQSENESTQTSGRLIFWK
jgi:hypothetical protein